MVKDRLIGKWQLSKNNARHRSYQLKNSFKRQIHPISVALRQYTPAVTWEIILAFTMLSIGMLFQPERFSNTPSYGNLIAIAPIQLWGTVYLMIACGLYLWRHTKSIVLGIVANVSATMLIFIWLLAFIIRWRTDNGTTIVNVVSWSLMLILAIRSITGIDEDQL